MENERNIPSSSSDSWDSKGTTSNLGGGQAGRDQTEAPSDLGMRSRDEQTSTSAMGDRAQETDTGAFNDWETSSNSLIASNRVEGTAVYNPARDRLGTIQHLMIDKLSGHTEFAVMSFGGFLGIGVDYYPIPWNKLTYETDMGGYVVNLAQDQLSGAPRHRQDEDPDYNADYTGEIGRYYGL
jgi:hypothetical protein